MSNSTPPPLLIRRDNIVAARWPAGTPTWTWHCRICRHYSGYIHTWPRTVEAALGHYRTSGHALP